MKKKKIIQYTHRSKNRLELFLSEIWIFPVYDNVLEMLEICFKKLLRLISVLTQHYRRSSTGY